MSQIVGIHIGPAAGQPLHAVPEIFAQAGEGLEGDRFFVKQAPASGPPRKSSEVTLIEMEALEALKRDYGIELSGAESRRNLLTRGIALNHLVGRRFRVGQAVLVGLKLCEPCGYMEKLTREGVRKGLIHRGGLRAAIAVSGKIRVNDPIQIEDA